MKRVGYLGVVKKKEEAAVAEEVNSTQLQAMRVKATGV
jgi:hypothetical protein